MANSKIDIIYPCDKSWCSMNKLDDKTRHCSSCKRDISDFSLQKEFNSDSIHCGHFSIDQVKTIRRQLTLKYVGTLSLSLLSLLGLTVAPILSQAQTPKQTSVKKKKGGKVKLAGQIKDRIANEGIPFANIVAKAGGRVLTQTRADSLGKFSFSLDTSKFHLEQIEVIFSSCGYLPDTINSIDISSDILQMEKEVVISLDGIVIRDSIPARLQYSFTGAIAISRDTTIEESPKKSKKKKKN